MSLFSDAERSFALAVSELGYANPFLEERIVLERRALGRRFVAGHTVWSASSAADGLNPNLERIASLVEERVATFAGRLRDGVEATPEEAALYGDLVAYRLYDRFENDLFRIAVAMLEGGPARDARPVYERFLAEGRALLGALGAGVDPTAELTHLFACFFQIRRAFHLVFRHLHGASMPAARLRAQVWQSIFTHDVRRYRRTLYGSMAQIPTLVTGPSGTGKEIVARAVGLSRYVPFDPRAGRFEVELAGSFHPVNLSALSPTLIESELFGHRRGAFTGALEDRAGWLEAAGAHGTIFLDEVGELDATIQVKLLRALQDRTFQRLGETRPRTFQGKVIAATNRDLGREIAAGRFRADFYFRLNADRIETPALVEQIAGDRDELAGLVRHAARRLVEDDEAPALTDEVLAVIERDLGLDYPWPGNFRELEQCVRNVLIRSSYRPSLARRPPDDMPAWLAEIASGELTADAVLGRYVTFVYARAGSYEEAGRRLGLDRRTVKAHVDPALCAELRGGDGSPAA